MKRSFLFVFSLVLSFLATSVLAQSSEDAILGTWLNTEKTAQIEIMKNGEQFLGKIISLETEAEDGKPITDTNNSDPELQNRPLKGLTILEGLSFKKGAWEGGTIYDPNSGKTYSCEVKLKNQKVLEVKGYLGFSWVGRTVEWTRIK